MLLIQTFPKQSESLFSFVLRTNSINGYYNFRSTFRYMFGEYNSYNPNVLNSQMSNFIMKNFSLNDDHYFYKFSRTKVVFNKIVISEKFIDKKRVKVCPKCINMYDYLSVYWQFVLVTSCHVHNCLLIDSCPSCKKKLSWNEYLLIGCTCGFRWSENHDNYLNTYVETVISHIIIDNENCSNQQIHNEVMKLNINDLTDLLLTISWLSSANNEFKNKYHLLEFDISLIHQRMQESLMVFTNWPIDFNNFLDELSKKFPDKILPKKNTITCSYWGRFYGFLQMNSDKYRFLTQAIKSYLAEEWSDGYTNNFKLIDFDNTKHKYYSLTDILNKYGMDRKLTKRLITSGKIKGSISKSNNRNIILVLADSLESFVKTSHWENSNHISSTEASKILGLNLQQLAELETEGVIISVCGPKSANVSRRVRYDLNSINLLFDLFQNKYEKNKMIENHVETIGLRDIGNSNLWATHFRPSYLEVILKVKNTNLSPCKVFENKVGIQQFCFSPADLINAFSEEFKVNKRLYTPYRLSRALRISLIDLKRGINEGYLDCIIKPNGNIETTFNSISNFKHTYISRRQH